MAEVTELVTRFSFSGSTQPLQQYNASLGKSIGLLGGMTAALGLAGGAMRKFTTDTLAGVDSLIDMSTETQNSVQDIRELSFMAQQSGGSVQAMEGTISSLSSSIRDAALNGSEDFARLGISIRDSNGQLKDSVQVFEEARDRLSHMDLQTAERQNLAEAIGIDPSLIRLLEMGNEQYAELRQNARQYAVITEDNKETILAYNNAQSEMTFAMQSLKTLAAVGMAPTMQRLSGVISELIANNKDWIVNGLKAAATWIGRVVEMVVRLKEVIALVVAAFASWKLVLAGMAVWANPAILIPAAIAAGIVALVLILDDLITYMDGGKSAIGSFIDMMSKIDFREMSEGIFGEGITDLLFGDFDKGLDKLSTQINAWAVELKNDLKDIFGKFFDWMQTEIDNLTPDWLRDLMQFESRTQMGPGPPSIQPGFATEGRGGSGGTTNQVEIGPITVHGASDAEGTGRAVSRALQRALRDADQHTRGGN